MSTQEWFHSVDKYSRWQPSLINLFIAFSSDLLELYCQELVYTILFMNKNYSNGNTRALISTFVYLRYWLFRMSVYYINNVFLPLLVGERGGSVVECRTPEREVRGSRPTAAVLCPWARHFTPRKYWLITQEAIAPSRHDWKIVDWDVKPQHNQPLLVSKSFVTSLISFFSTSFFRKIIVNI